MKPFFIFSLSFFLLSFTNLEEELKTFQDQLDKKTVIENPEKSLQLLNVSYDPTREFYEEVNENFTKWWKEKTGQTVTIVQSHGGSAKQARAISQGLPADVATLSYPFDIDELARQTHYIPSDWANRLPNHSIPFTSTILFLVRENNPKNIKDWDDLIKENISLIIPNPKTSGVARWIYLAAWGYALKKYNNDENSAKFFMKKLFKNVPILDTGARGATSTFMQQGIGDVLVTWENEAHLAMQHLGDKKVDIVIPPISILSETPVVWIDNTTTKKGTKEQALAYLSYLYTKEVQNIAAKHFLRPIDKEVLIKHQKQFPSMELFTIDDFGGSDAIQKKHFTDGALFDQIYIP